MSAQSNDDGAFAARIEAMSRNAMDTFVHNEDVLRKYADIVSRYDLAWKEVAARGPSLTESLRHLKEQHPYLGVPDVSTPNARQSHGRFSSHLTLNTPERTPSKLQRIASGLGLAQKVEETASSPTSLSEKRTDDWLTVLIWIHRAVILQLRTLAKYYNNIRWLKNYWDWAHDYPVGYAVHCFFTSPRKFWSNRHLGYQGRKTQTLATLSRLNLLEMSVVESLGKLHNNLQSMISSLTSLGSVIDQCNPTISTDEVTELDENDNSGEMPSLSATLELGDELEAIAKRLLLQLDPVTHEHSDEADECNFSLKFEKTILRTETIALESSQKGEVGDAYRKLMHVLQRTVRWNHAVEHILWDRDLPPAGRHWLRLTKYVVFGGIALRYTLKMSGSQWSALIKTAISNARYFMHAYLIEPAKGVYSALTIQRYPSERRKQDIQEEVESLGRMILDYHHDNFVLSKDEMKSVETTAYQEQLGRLSNDYEKAIRTPIRSAIFGNLWRLILIQLQKQKVDINRVMLSSDEVLEQNDLNFKMMALAPFIMMNGLLIFYLWGERERRRKPLYARMRLCWRNLQRHISLVEKESDMVPDIRGRLGRRAVSATATLKQLDQGYVVLQVHEMRNLASYLPAKETSRMFVEDLNDIEDMDATKGQRLRTLQRMYFTYKFLQPTE